MTYQSMQTWCQVIAAIGGVMVALGSYGAYYYGKKADAEKQPVRDTVITAAKPHVSKTSIKTNIAVKQNSGTIIGEQTNNINTHQAGSKERPSVNICRRGISLTQVNDTTGLFDIPYCAEKNANAYNLKLNAITIFRLQDVLRVVNRTIDSMPDNITVSYENGVALRYTLSPYREVDKSYTLIYVKGTFTNDDETKIFSVNDVFKYDTYSQTWMKALGKEDNEARSFLKDQHLY